MIQDSQQGSAADFIYKANKNATPANDQGRVPKLEADGMLDDAFLNSKSLKKLMTAGENLTAGMPVGVSTDGFSTGIARANRSVIDLAHGITTPLNTGSSQNHFCPIGGDKFITLQTTAASSGTLFATVGTVDKTTNSISLGTPSVVDTTLVTGAGNYMCSKLNTNKFIVFYLTSSTNIINYRVGTVSGSTITWGTAATAGNTTVSQSDQYMFREQIATDKGVIGWKNGTQASGRVVCYTVSGTVATFGTAIIISGTNCQVTAGTFLKTIATDKFVIITATTQMWGQVATISGTTISFGSEVQLYSSTYYSYPACYSVVSPVTDSFLITFQGSTYQHAMNIACSVSGTVITVGTPLDVNDAIGSVGFYQGNYGIYMVNSTTFLLIGGGSGGEAIAKITRSGNTLTSNGFVSYLSTRVQSATPFPMDNGYYILFNYWGDNSNVKYYISGMSENFIGFVTATVSAGQTVIVTVGGINSNQSGLAVGRKYLVLNGVLNEMSSIKYVDTQDDIDIVKAISATEVVF